MASSWPALWFDLPLAVFDLETTGLDYNIHQIIEVGIVQFYRGEVVKVLNWLIDPKCKLPDEIVRLTHIRQEDVDGQPEFKDVAPQILEAFAGHGIVAYNIAFDRPFLTHKLREIGLDWPQGNPLIDPLIFAKHFYPKEKSNKLGVVAERLGVSLEGAHRACNDAEATGKVLYAFRNQLPPDLQNLLIIQAQWERENQEKAAWRRNDNEDDNQTFADLVKQQSGKGLTSAFAYGNEPDPLRAIYSTVPSAKRN